MRLDALATEASTRRRRRKIEIPKSERNTGRSETPTLRGPLARRTEPSDERTAPSGQYRGSK